MARDTEPNAGRTIGLKRETKRAEADSGGIAISSGLVRHSSLYGVVERGYDELASVGLPGG